MNYLKQAQELKKKFEMPIEKGYKEECEFSNKLIKQKAKELKTKAEKGCGKEYEEWLYDEEGVPMSKEYGDCGHMFGYCEDCKKTINICGEILK